MRSQSLSALALFAALTLASSASAALVAPYANAAAFQATLQPGSYLETFNSLPSGVLPTTWNFSSGGFAYTASAIGGSTLWTGDGDTGSQFLSVENRTNQLRFTFASGTPTAGGGVFFGSDFDENFRSSTITFTFSDSSTYSFDAMTLATTPFLGLTTEGSSPITWVTISAKSTTADYAWVSVDNFVVGHAIANAVPESSTYGLVAALVLGFAIWRRRK